MNIRHLISTAGLYGAERVVVDLATYTRAQGHQVAVWLLESPGVDEVMAALEEKRVPAERIVVGRGGLPEVCLRLRKRIREEEVDILHSHGYRTDVAVGLAGMFSSVRRVATCHTWYSNSIKLRLYEMVDKMALRLFHRVVVVSPQLRWEVKNAGIPLERVRLVLNGTNFLPSMITEGKSVRAEYGIKEESRLLLRVGRLDQDKGNETLLEAFAKGFAGQEAVLLFVGEGDERDALEQQVARLGIRDRVHFAGYRTDVGRFLQAADLFVLSSYKEGLPIALLEAMACRKPIVATEVGAIGSVITHGRDGWLVPPRNVDVLADALRKVASNPVLAERLGESAHERYRECHTLEAMGHQYIKIYKESTEAG